MLSLSLVRGRQEYSQACFSWNPPYVHDSASSWGVSKATFIAMASSNNVIE